jgi:hypothetical protein
VAAALWPLDLERSLMPQKHIKQRYLHTWNSTSSGMSKSRLILRLKSCCPSGPGRTLIRCTWFPKVTICSQGGNGIEFGGAQGCLSVLRCSMQPWHWLTIIGSAGSMPFGVSTTFQSGRRSTAGARVRDSHLKPLSSRAASCCPLPMRVGGPRLLLVTHIVIERLWYGQEAEAVGLCLTLLFEKKEKWACCGLWLKKEHS